MQVVALASDKQWKELTDLRPHIEWARVSDSNEFLLHQNAGAYLNLVSPEVQPFYDALGKPVFIHSVIESLQELGASTKVLRINAWPGFLQRPSWEIAGNVDNNIPPIFDALGIRMHAVADEPGFVSARIISMIINEAYLALEDGVSTKEEIDIAMKLGTNYPFGPFEWANAIGIKNILTLLDKLSRESSRYTPSTILRKEADCNNEPHPQY